MMKYKRLMACLAFSSLMSCQVTYKTLPPPQSLADDSLCINFKQGEMKWRALPNGTWSSWQSGTWEDGTLHFNSSNEGSRKNKTHWSSWRYTPMDKKHARFQYWSDSHEGGCALYYDLKLHFYKNSILADGKGADFEWEMKFRKTPVSIHAHQQQLAPQGDSACNLKPM